MEKKLEKLIKDLRIQEFLFWKEARSCFRNNDPEEGKQYMLISDTYGEWAEALEAGLTAIRKGKADQKAEDEYFIRLENRLLGYGR